MWLLTAAAKQIVEKMYIYIKKKILFVNLKSVLYIYYCKSIVWMAGIVKGQASIVQCILHLHCTCLVGCNIYNISHVNIFLPSVFFRTMWGRDNRQWTSEFIHSDLENTKDTLKWPGYQGVWRPVAQQLTCYEVWWEDGMAMGGVGPCSLIVNGTRCHPSFVYLC